MQLKKHIFTLAILSLFSSCISTLNTSKPKSTEGYSEDLSAYLPEEIIDSTSFSLSENNPSKIVDSTLVITERLDSALVLVNTYNDETTKYIEGLTIQLYSGNDRSKAKNVQMKAYRYYSESKPRIIFDQPNYKVRMEHFYSQLEAYPVFKDVHSRFPRAILVPARIPVSKK